MVAAVTERHGEGDIVNRVTAVHISCDDLPKNTLTGYDPDNYPASPEVTYYFQAELSGQDDLRSQVFAPDDGHGEWHGLVFPAAGTWAVHARKVSDDSSVASLNVEVE
jgi:hypothetical protein